jgi:CRISPR system Cascade subunit CasB
LSDSPWDVALVDELVRLADRNNPNRAVLAHLRRGLDHPLAHVLSRVGWLFCRVPESRKDNLLHVAALVAGLFAWVKGDCLHVRGVNFGAAFGANLPLEQKQQREKRFIDLLDTDSEELPYKLRQAITLIAREGGRLDWVMTLDHLHHWSHPDRWVQKEWAKGFWEISTKKTTNTETVSSTQP